MGSPDPDVLDEPRLIDSSGGVRLATYDFDGPGAGDDLLLVHANGFCAGVWWPMASLLDGYRRAAIDLRGHGRSSLPTGGTDDLHWNGTADDVLAAVDALDLGRPVGVGHSMGGAALVLAEQRRPGTFRALWLYEPIIFPFDGTLPPPGPNPLSTAARRRRTDFPSAEAAFANFAAKRPLDELHPDCLAAYVRYGFEERPDGSVTLRCRPEVEAANFELGGHHDAWAHLGELSCPVVVARGAADPGTPAAFADRIAARPAHGRLEEHPDLGHFGPLADLEGMARSVRALVTG